MPPSAFIIRSVLWLGFTRRRGRPGIVMEFMPRGSLWGFLTSRGRGPAGAAAEPALSTAQQRAVALDIACGLAYLHAIPILHLDLKVSGRAERVSVEQTLEPRST